MHSPQEHAPRAGWILPFGLLMVIAAALAWQHRTTRQLRIELASAREANRELAGVRAKQAQLAADALPPGQLEQLRADRAALVRLRAEIEQMKQRAAAAPPTVAVTAAAPPHTRGPAEPLIRVDQMRHAGRATPRDAGETFVWALQRGDIDTAAGLLAFTPEARAKMEQVLATLPPQFRNDYGTPERLMAFVMAGNSSVAAIRFVGVMEAGPDTVTQLVDVERKTGGVAKDKVLLRRDGDGWRRLITPSTVDALANYLAASPPKFHVEAARE